MELEWPESDYGSSSRASGSAVDLLWYQTDMRAFLFFDSLPAGMVCGTKWHELVIVV